VITKLTSKLEILTRNDYKNIDYKIALGKEKSTLLPLNTFDKVIIRNSFHHFSYPDDMLRNCKALLKDGGKLFIVDVMLN
ncbi:MAG: class I SAM-dependent methyltransferase, partial [Chryseolinea sp.]